MFTAWSAAAALAPGIGWLVAARAVQGVGSAIVIPPTLTLLSAAVTPGRRGLAIAIGPLVGGAVVEDASWQWIFWLNVPIGIALLPIARARLTESHGPATGLDVPALVLASLGLLGVVYGVVRGNDHGWTSATVLAPIVIGAALVTGFVAWELLSAVFSADGSYASGRADRSSPASQRTRPGALTTRATAPHTGPDPHASASRGDPGLTIVIIRFGAAQEQAIWAGLAWLIGAPAVAGRHGQGDGPLFSAQPLWLSSACAELRCRGARGR